jgi:hypothetical protein
VYLQGTPSCTSGGTWGSFSWLFQTSPYEVNISHLRFQQPTDQCTAYYCFEVTSGTGTPEAHESWYWVGDGWGGPPHWPCSSDGYTPAGQSTCDEAINPPAAIPPCGPFISLSPETVTGSSCGGDPVLYDFTLLNNTGVDSFFDIFYDVPTYNGELTGPAQLWVVNGASVPFQAALTGRLCGQAGENITGLVSVAGAGYSDQSTIQQTALVSSWEEKAQSPIATMDAAVNWAMNDGGLWVIGGDGWDPGVGGPVSASRWTVATA